MCPIVQQDVLPGHAVSHVGSTVVLGDCSGLSAPPHPAAVTWATAVTSTAPSSFRSCSMAPPYQVATSSAVHTQHVSMRQLVAVHHSPGYCMYAWRVAQPLPPGVWLPHDLHHLRQYAQVGRPLLHYSNQHYLPLLMLLWAAAVCCFHQHRELDRKGQYFHWQQLQLHSLLTCGGRPHHQLQRLLPSCEG
jgi:hypothetical protein